jgi:small subunit ribosomal protein S1
VKDLNKFSKNDFFEPDEAWWKAILADEPLMIEDSRSERPEDIPNFFIDEEICEEKGSGINWSKIKHTFAIDEIISMRVTGYNRGGLLLEKDDIAGFVPASHLIDLPPNITTAEREDYFVSYLDKEISVKVIECDPQKERVVFSERAALAKAGQRKHLLHQIQEGDVICGVVTNLTSFGAFVDLGGLEGLIHVSELSWGRVKDPSDILHINQEITAEVLDVSEQEGKIALSLKRLQDNPWEHLSEKLSPGTVIEADVSCIEKYGAFVRLEEGIEGLIHISSIRFPEGCDSIEDLLCCGQRVRVSVLNIDPEKRRLGLKLEGCLTA